VPFNRPLWAEKRDKMTRLEMEKELYQEALKDIAFLNIKGSEKGCYLQAHITGVGRAFRLMGLKYEEREKVLAA
jgi:hypothetical protein